SQIGKLVFDVFVSDLEEAIERYTGVYGFGPWRTSELVLHEPEFRGEPVEFGLRAKDRRSERPLGNSAGGPWCWDSLQSPSCGCGLQVFLPRDERGTEKRPAVYSTEKMPICRYFIGRDETRTRDLRRDRPVLALAGEPG